MGTVLADRYREKDNVYNVMNMIFTTMFDWFILPIANPDGYSYSRQVQGNIRIPMGQ